MHTRRGNTEVFAVAYLSKSPKSWAVQEFERNDYRPAARHYSPRFRTVKVARQAVAERVALHMRTDGRRVRILAK
jgi:hypothetical protein